MAAQGSDGNPIHLGDDREGRMKGSDHYRFESVGESMRYCDPFDPDCLPSQPLAISRIASCLFLATPNGFCVTRIEYLLKHEMDAAERLLLLLNLPIGNVSMLVMSRDESMLAAVFQSHIQFFSVNVWKLQGTRSSWVPQHEAEEAIVSLYSVSLHDCGGYIKDMKWAKEGINAYLVLSTNGNLYHGSGQASPTLIMEEINAFDFGVGFVVVAKNNSLRILSLAFDEIKSFLLPFISVNGDSDVTKKVDSVRYVRPNSLAVGSFELNSEGKEEYIVRIVTSRRGGPIMQESSVPVVYSFGFFSDSNHTVPVSGPHMFLKHLDVEMYDPCRLRAFRDDIFAVNETTLVANPKMSHIVGLLRWDISDGSANLFAADIRDDAWTFHPDPYQDNGEDNILIGMCVSHTRSNMFLNIHDDHPSHLVGGMRRRALDAGGFYFFCVSIDGKVSAHEFNTQVRLPEYLIY